MKVDNEKFIESVGEEQARIKALNNDEPDGAKGKVILFVGGARSGKSAFAEKVAARFENVAYVATAEAIDDEMRERIAKHRESRPGSWSTHEAEGNLADATGKALAGANAIIVDCLTVYTARRMEKTADDDEIILEVVKAVKLAKKSQATALFVTNEVGLGLVPEHPVGRRYRDLLGKVNQRVAEMADHVYFMVAGIPVDIKALGKAGPFGDGVVS